MEINEVLYPLEVDAPDIIEEQQIFVYGGKGDKGDPAGFGIPVATASQIGESLSPTVSVEASGLDTAKVFTFHFGIPKGHTPVKGVEYFTDAEIAEFKNDIEEAAETYIDQKVNNSTITIKQGNITKGSFTLNQAEDATITLGDEVELISVSDFEAMF